MSDGTGRYRKAFEGGRRYQKVAEGGRGHQKKIGGLANWVCAPSCSSSSQIATRSLRSLASMAAPMDAPMATLSCVVVPYSVGTTYL